jgi:hypothetical protein
MNKFIQQGLVKQISATVLAPVNAGLRLILNFTSESGSFEGKFDKLLSKRWTRVREDFKFAFATRQNFKPGSITTTAVGSDTWVVNMLCKDKDGTLDKKTLALGMRNLVNMAKSEHGSVHVSNLLLEELPELNELVVKNLVENGVNVYLYEEPVSKV